MIRCWQQYLDLQKIAILCYALPISIKPLLLCLSLRNTFGGVTIVIKTDRGKLLLLEKSDKKACITGMSMIGMCGMQRLLLLTAMVVAVFAFHPQQSKAKHTHANCHFVKNKIRWSAEEDRKLIGSVVKGEPLPAIATKLNRTTQAVRTRWYRKADKIVDISKIINELKTIKQVLKQGRGDMTSWRNIHDNYFPNRSYEFIAILGQFALQLPKEFEERINRLSSSVHAVLNRYQLFTRRQQKEQH